VTNAGRALPTVRLLHTSDVHVAADPSGIEGLRAIVRAAARQSVDAVLIAGDLFDSSRVPEEAVEATLTELGRLTCPVVVIPGNHDCVDERSIYHRVDLATAGDHVVFAGDPAGQHLVFEDLRLAVWARGIEDHHPGHRPLTGYTPAAPGYWQVVLTHGHYVPTGEDSYRSSPIGQDEIAGLACHYVALGHWHRFVDISQGSVRACYSGSPSMPVADGPTANLVTLDPERGVTVERLPL
jgi:DNA repair protein SbcD/Mre11